MTFAPQAPASAGTVIFPGQLTTVGNWLSTTVMVNEQVLVFPEASE